MIASLVTYDTYLLVRGIIVSSAGISDSKQESSIRYYLRDLLDRTKDEKSVDLVLEDIGRHYDADRAYLFELDSIGSCWNNTYEWCREGVNPEKDNLQNIPVEGLECWFEAFENEGEFFISSLSEDYTPDSRTDTGAAGHRVPDGCSLHSRRKDSRISRCRQSEEKYR